MLRLIFFLFECRDLKTPWGGYMLPVSTNVVRKSKMKKEGRWRKREEDAATLQVKEKKGLKSGPRTLRATIQYSHCDSS